MVQLLLPAQLVLLKALRGLLICGLAGMLNACQPTFSQVTAPTHVTQVNPAYFQVISSIDVGQGLKTPAQFSLNIQTQNCLFAVQANSDGVAHKRATDIQSFDVYLIDSATAPSGSLTPAHGPYIVSASLSSGQQTIQFNNVTASSNDYYVAIKAKDSGGENITNTGSGASISGENVYISSSGGGGNGQVSIGSAPTYTVSTTSTLQVALSLKDAIGATLDTRLSVTDGSTYNSSDIAYFKIYLVDNNTSNPNINYGPFTVSNNLDGNGDQSISVLHLRPGTYYIAMAAYNNLDQNLSDSSLDVDSSSAAISDSGGESSFPGRITVNSDYTVSTSTEIQVDLNLL